jgi:hypothetical protein
MMRAGIKDPALAAIAEVVHDIDLKDAKFGREEGIAHAHQAALLLTREALASPPATAL